MTVSLPFREPQLGRDYWIEDGILPHALDVARRCIARSTWILGSPWRPESWPGMRAPDALLPDELRRVEACVTQRLHLAALRPQTDSDMGRSGHNHIHICGGGEGVARPHVDSASVCDYAAVLYLHPNPPTTHAGTSFYRLHLPGEAPGGNVCPREYESLRDVPSMPHDMDPTCFEEILEVPYVFNRLLVYSSDLIHSATSYFGWSGELASRRMAVVFFWKAAQDAAG